MSFTTVRDSRATPERIPTCVKPEGWLGWCHLWLSHWMSLICAKSWSLVTCNSYCHFWNWAFIGIWHHVMVLVYLIYSYFQLSSVWGTTDWQARAAFQGKACLFHWRFQVPLLCDWDVTDRFPEKVHNSSRRYLVYPRVISHKMAQLSGTDGPFIIYRWFPPETKRGDGTKGRQRSFTWMCFPMVSQIWFPMVSQ